jgi:hypothetical protein
MFLAVYIVCAVAALAPIWCVKYPPMTDLPQYAAQLSIIKNLHDPAFGFEGVFQVSWYSPYILAMGLARFFYEFFDVLTALRITVSISILALPLSIAALLKAAEADPWLAVLGFPLSYGFSFYWGLLSFQFALPFGFAVIALGFSYGRRRGMAKALLLACGCLLLFFAHLTILFCAILILIPYLWLSGRGLRDKARNLAPLIAPLPLVAVWLASVPGNAKGIRFASAAIVGKRLLNLPGLVYDADPSAWLTLVSALWAWILVRQYRFRGVGPISITTGIIFVLYLFAPSYFVGDVFLSGRLAVFLGVLVMANFGPSAEMTAFWIKRSLNVAAVLFWMILLTMRFGLYDMDARAFDPLLHEMRPQKMALGLIFDRRHEAVSALPFLHFVNWYQAYKGGITRHSFASYEYPTLATFISRDERALHAHYESLAWVPKRFNWNIHSKFDYFIVRSQMDRGPVLFSKADGRVQLVRRSGHWWLYENTRPSGEGYERRARISDMPQ